MTQKAFQKSIVDYYKKNKRTFPWRPPTLKLRTDKLDAYAILVSEIMLQQTQTDRVVPKYENWLKLFPTFESLAQAPLQKVLIAWKGLGYNSRALRLKRAAEVVVEKYGGKLPAEYEKILDLPGIGPYTAGAVMAFAFNKPYPIIETNIRTVFIYFFASSKLLSEDGFLIHDQKILKLVKKTLPERNIRDWYYALMDYGVMLKKTHGNLNTKSKHYTKQSAFKGSNRELRAKILHLITEKPVTIAKIYSTIKDTDENIKTNLTRLEKEGFINNKNGVYCIN